MILLKTNFFLMMLTLCYTARGQKESMKGMSTDHNAFKPIGIITGHQAMRHMWMFSYTYMNTLQSNHISGTSKVDDQSIFKKYIMAPKKMAMDMHMLMGMYSISDRFSFMLMLNYLAMNMNMNMLPGTMNMDGTMNMGTATGMNCNAHGLGDIKFYTEYNMAQGNAHIFVADLGISIPTGAITKSDLTNVMFMNQRLSYMMQTGSGTFDLLPGITYSGNANAFSWGAQATSIIHTYYNKFGYKQGDNLTINAWASYQWFDWLSSSFRLSGNSLGNIRGADPQMYRITEPDSDPGNYGGTTVNGFIGINCFFKDDFLKNNKLGAEYGVPMYQNLQGIQLALKGTFYISWMLTFD